MSTAADPIETAVAAEWRPRFNPWAIAMTVTLATFMEVLDTSIANVALPHIAGNLSISQDEAAWVLTSYLVANAVILPISAWLSTKFGRKRSPYKHDLRGAVRRQLADVRTGSQSASAGARGESWGYWGRRPRAHRTSQALGPTPSARKRGQAFGLCHGRGGRSGDRGPTLGGYITDNFSWRWLFLINVPVAVLSLVLSARMLEDPPFLEKLRKKMFTVDYVGLGLLATGIGCLQVALDKGEREDWFASSFIVSFSIIAVVALVTAIIWEYHHPHPVLDVRLFKSRNFRWVACIMTAHVRRGFTERRHRLDPAASANLDGLPPRTEGGLTCEGRYRPAARRSSRFMLSITGSWVDGRALKPIVFLGFSSNGAGANQRRPSRWTLDIDFATASVMFRVYQVIGMQLFARSFLIQRPGADWHIPEKRLSTSR